MGHTVIQVPVPAFEPIARRLDTTLVCPHVTLLGPFVDRRDVDEDLVTIIGETLTPVGAFNFELSHVGHFGGGLTYLAPNPTDPFIRLTKMFTSIFPKWPPYGGAFDEVVPHLSIGAGLREAELEMLGETLPIAATADEVTLTWWSEDAVEVLVRFPLA